MPALTNERTQEDCGQTEDAVSGYEVYFDPRAHFDEWLRSVKNITGPIEPQVTLSQPLSPLSAIYLDSVNASSCELSFEGVLHFGGHMRGNLHSANGIVLSGLGSVETEIDVRVALIDGLVKGKITASERIVLESQARVVGQVMTPAAAD